MSIKARSSPFALRPFVVYLRGMRRTGCCSDPGAIPKLAFDQVPYASELSELEDAWVSAQLLKLMPSELMLRYLLWLPQ